MFLGARAVRSAKFLKSGMYSRGGSASWRTVGAKIPIHAAPMELGRACGVGVAINMALLAELGLRLKMRVRGSACFRSVRTR